MPSEEGVFKIEVLKNAGLYFFQAPSVMVRGSIMLRAISMEITLSGGKLANNFALRSAKGFESCRFAAVTSNY